MLSDFLFDLDREQLGAVAFRHDLVGIAVNHPSEIEPPPCGLAAVRDSETGETLVADFGIAGRDVCRQTYRTLPGSLARGVRSGPAPICWNSTPAAIAQRNWPGSSATASGEALMKPEVDRMALTWHLSSSDPVRKIAAVVGCPPSLAFQQ